MLLPQFPSCLSLRAQPGTGGWTVLLMAVGLSEVVAAAEPTGEVDPALLAPPPLRALVEQYCTDCHNPEKQKGDLDLVSRLTRPDADYLSLWEDVQFMLEEREMPPVDEPAVARPSEAEYEAALGAMTGYLVALRSDLPAGHLPLTVASPDALVSEYCVSCHGPDKQEGGLSLAAIADAAVPAHPAEWEKVVRRLRAGQMPPVGRKRPSDDEFATVLGQVIEQLDARDKAAPDPGRTSTFRRLTRHEYRNVVRDLLGLEFDTTELLPRDESSHGFDNITVGDLPPALLERYISSAQLISRLALGTPTKAPQGTTVRVAPDFSQESHVPGLPVGTRGGAVIDQIFPADGDYDIEVRLMRDRNEHLEGLREPHQMELLIDRELVASFTVLPPKSPRDHETGDAGLKTRVRVAAGQRQVGVTFVKKPVALIETQRQPYLARFNMHRHPRQSPAVYQVSITGPYGQEGAPDAPTRARIFVATPESAGGPETAAREILAHLMRRAYRRPVHEADLERPLALYRETATAEGFEAGIEMALSAVLVSPEFLFRIERDPVDIAPGGVYAVTDLELASRLSFFLWSSIPDEELLTLAEQGRLSEPAVRQAQVERMLRDPRA